MQQQNSLSGILLLPVTLEDGGGGRMFWGGTSVSVLVCLGIAAIIIIGCLVYGYGRRKQPGGAPAAGSQPVSPTTNKSEPISAKVDFPTPWHAKVSPGALPPASQSAPAAKQAAPKPKGRPAPVGIMVSGSIERPVVKKGTGTNKGRTK